MGSVVAGARFLAVDDEPIIASSLQRIARRYGEVVVATTVAEAREQLADPAWRGFVVDLELPDGSGLDLLVDIRRAFPLAPVLMLTAHVDGPLVNAAYDLRAEVLNKPADSGRIGRFMEKALSLGAVSEAEPPPVAAMGERIEQLRALMGRRPLDAQARWEIGRVVAELKSRPERYGEGAVALAASILGEDVPTMYRHARVAERWGAPEWQALLERRTPGGKALSWSHLVVLTTIEPQERCAAWTERALEEELTVRELEEAIAHSDQKI
jgi:ActR/RegA family two-component response regulator